MKFLRVLLAVSLISPLLSQKADKDWVVIFADEFNGTELDLSRWAPHDPWGQVRDRQLQAWEPEAAKVSGGQLHLVARRAAPHDAHAQYDGKEREYVSGIVTTFGTFAQTYGRFEIRCRVPAERGLLPGFQLLPVPRGSLPGIDVFETAGSAPSRVYFANRWGTEQTERSFADSFTAPDLSSGFHTIAVEWDAAKIAWFVDGKQMFQATEGIPHQPMYLLIDLAVGGNIAKAPDASTKLPASFDIEYVRVYQRR